MTPHALIAPARLAGAPLLRAQSDERLVDLVRAGNEAAFEAIVARYRRPLLRYCTGFMAEARAEDAVQTSFVNAFNALRSSQGDLNLRPWLYRIAHNTALNALRDRGLSHEELSEEIDGVERPDQAFEKNERLHEVVTAVTALPDRQRNAIVLRELEGRSYDEIASELGVSDGSVRQLLNRARNTLRSGMTAVTPFGLLARVPWGAGPGESVASRVAEMCAGGAGTAALTKVCATAIVTGAVVGGVAGSPTAGIDDGKATNHPRDTPGHVVASHSPRSKPGPSLPAGEGRRGGSGTDAERRRDGASGGEDAGGDRRRRGEQAGEDHRGREGGDDRSGSGGGPGRDGSGGGGNSGPGGGSDDRPGEDHGGRSGGGGSSGPGSGDPSVSGSLDDPSGPSLDGSGSGSGSSGSGSGGGDGGGDGDGDDDPPLLDN